MGRFTGSDQLVALVWVDPQLHQSGQTAGQKKMSDLPSLRRVIWHAALTASRLNPEDTPMVKKVEAQARAAVW